NYVLGIDLSISRLRLAIGHKVRNGLRRTGFVQMNVVDSGIKDNVFDVVVVSPAAYQTANAKLVFRSIVQKAKPNGTVIVGLYNRFGRLPAFLRSKFSGLFGHDYLRPRKAEIWFKDTNYDSQETWHSLDEVMNWFDDSDVEFLNCYPQILGA